MHKYIIAIIKIKYYGNIFNGVDIPVGLGKNIRHLKKVRNQIEFSEVTREIKRIAFAESNLKLFFYKKKLLKIAYKCTLVSKNSFYLF